MGPEEAARMLTAIIVFATIGVTIILRGPVGRALARRIEGKSSQEPAMADRLEEMELRLADMEQDRTRVAELEERLDFAERMLAKSPERLGGKAP